MKCRDRLLAALKALPEWLVMLAPVGVLLVSHVDAMLDLRYLTIKPTLSWGMLKVTMLGLLPTIVIGAMKLVSRFRAVPVRRAVRKWLTVLCIVYYIPFGFFMSCMTSFGLSYCSETEDIAQYKQVDSLLHVPSVAWEMFPEEAQDAAGKYYYYCDYDHDHNLYAEWTLPPEELAAEIARAEALLWAEGTYQRVRHGDFQCLIVTEGHRFTPFELDEYSSNHCLTMFAYNEETGVVRYISCDEYGSLDDPPYYLTLDW